MIGKLTSNNTYMLERCPQRYRRAHPNAEPVEFIACYTAHIRDDLLYTIPFGENHDWTEVYGWLNENVDWWFTWTAFTGEWRREFAFRDAASAIAFEFYWRPN